MTWCALDPHATRVRVRSALHDCYSSAPSGAQRERIQGPPAGRRQNAIAIARSNELPDLRRSAGARLVRKRRSGS